MVKGKMNNKDWANNVSVIFEGKENTRGKILGKSLHCMKMR
jgi:hypothetical protein